jgi:hypothetical protein
MVERSAIFNAKGIQLGYIEGNAAFDCNGTQRCSYAVATGNLCDLKNGNIVGHVSLDGTFVGATWVADELFGKPTDNAAAKRAPRTRDHHGSKTAIVERPASAARQSDAAPRAVIYPDDQERLSSSAQPVGDVGAAPCLKSNLRLPGSVLTSVDENALIEHAMSMIRSALVKGNSDGDA